MEPAPPPETAKLGLAYEVWAREASRGGGMTAWWSRTALVVFSALLWVGTASAQHTLTGRVVAVADGDTLTLLDSSNTQHRIRLESIDAPESGQPFGNRSGRLLRELCHRKTATVRYNRQDRYGRVLGTVYCDGLDVNAEMVRQGMAWVYVQFAPRNSPLFELEREAREARIGLWADPAPVEPWRWRRGERSASGAGATRASPGSGAAPEVRGNRNSMIYHLPHCQSFDSVSSRNRVIFRSEAEAQRAGFRRARNC